MTTPGQCANAVIKGAALYLLILPQLLLTAGPGLAQSLTVTATGVSGEMDSRKRDPVVSVSKVVGSENVKLLVDAHVPAPDYRQYPLRFQFFINRSLFSTQFRSDDLPGPIGVDIGPDVATPPFNFTVIAEVIHPNRTFSTVINGAVFSADFVAELDCSLTLTSEDTAEEFTADAVETTQSGEGSFALIFDGTDENESTVSVATVVKVAGSNGTASVRYVKDGETQLIDMSGEVEVVEGSLDSFTLSSSDESAVLSCF